MKNTKSATLLIALLFFFALTAEARQSKNCVNLKLSDTIYITPAGIGCVIYVLGPCEFGPLTAASLMGLYDFKTGKSDIIPQGSFVAYDQETGKRFYQNIRTGQKTIVPCGDKPASTVKQSSPISSEKGINTNAVANTASAVDSKEKISTVTTKLTGKDATGAMVSVRINPTEIVSETKIETPVAPKEVVKTETETETETETNPVQESNTEAEDIPIPSAIEVTEENPAPSQEEAVGDITTPEFSEPSIENAKNEKNAEKNTETNSIKPEGDKTEPNSVPQEDKISLNTEQQVENPASIEEKAIEKTGEGDTIPVKNLYEYKAIDYKNQPLAQKEAEKRADDLALLEKKKKEEESVKPEAKEETEREKEYRLKVERMKKQDEENRVARAKAVKEAYEKARKESVDAYSKKVDKAKQDSLAAILTAAAFAKQKEEEKQKKEEAKEARQREKALADSVKVSEKIREQKAREQAGQKVVQGLFSQKLPYDSVKTSIMEDLLNPKTDSTASASAKYEKWALSQKLQELIKKLEEKKKKYRPREDKDGKKTQTLEEYLDYVSPALTEK